MSSVTSMAATAAFWVSFAAWMVAEMLVFIHGRRIDAPGEDRDGGSVWPLLGAAFVAIPLAVLAALFIPAARIPGGWALFGAGLVLIWMGIGLRLWAVISLGSFFQPTVTIQAEHKLITRGPYRMVRHPSYTGALLTLFGMGLAMGNVVSVLLLVVLPVLGYLPRIRIEEHALGDALGEEYAEYQKSSARLVPGVW